MSFGFGFSLPADHPVLTPTLYLDFVGTGALDSRITFTRGSQATLFDSAGTLVYAKHNLLLQSQTFQTSWTATRSSLSTDATTAPDGTLTADQLIEDTTASNTHIIFSADVSVPAAVVLVYSVYLKPAGRTWVNLQIATGSSAYGATVPFCYFNLSGAGTVGNAGAATGSITAVGNGWYRCVVTAVATTSASTTNLRIKLATADGTDSYTGDGTSGVFLWGAQLNLSNMEGGVTSSLTTYYPTTTAAYYGPRFDYNPSTLAARGLLIEEARTNSIRNNTMQGAVAGTPGTAPTNWGINTTNAELSSSVVGTGTESGITYIDVRINGTVTAARDLNINFEGINVIAATSGQTWTESIYLRQVAGSQSNIATIHLQGNTYTAALAYVNSPWFVTRTVTTAPLSTQRLEASGTLAGATIAFVAPFIKVTTAASGAVDFTLRIGLPQLELGAFATSVIPTTTTALTRNADVASMTGTNFSSWYNAVEGTLVGFGASNLSASKVQFFAAVDTNTQNYISLARFSGATGGTSRTVDTNSIQADMALGTLTTLVPFKLATAYKVNDFASSTNGAAAVTDTAGTVPTVNKLSVGNLNGTLQINGHIQRIAYYPSRLPDTTLQALTA